jgi:hypothetical protein
MQVAEISGYVAAVLVFMTFYMKTMIPLRIVGICSNCAFIMYGYLDGLHQMLILHLTLLPLNSLRLARDVDDLKWSLRITDVHPWSIAHGGSAHYPAPKNPPH